VQPGNATAPELTMTNTRALPFMHCTVTGAIPTHLFKILLVLISVTLICGCGLRRPAPVDASSPPGHAVMEYVIGPSDVLSIGVWNHKDLNRTVTVRPDGKFSFALAGEIEATGLTPVQLQANLEKALRRYVDIVPGEVSVVVDEVHSYKVSVLGEVRQPGQFEFQIQSTVLDALAMAGGLTEFTSGKNVIVMRRNQGQTEKLHFDYRKLVDAPSDDQRSFIFPGDVIVVR
jgi:polysaccharide export outer membrane protein